MAVAFVYPGQGSQSIGMGKDLYDNFQVAKDIMLEVNNALNQDLKTLMFEGPNDTLTLTENTQPALLCASLMAQKVLEQELGLPIEKLASAVAGHSLGEYSALTAAGCFKASDAALLVKLRGNSMQKAVPVGKGAMAAILGLDLNIVQTLVGDMPNSELRAEIANDNSPGQIVVSGHAEAINIVIERAKENGAKRALLLPVSAPFHSSLMHPAADVMNEALANVTISDFQVKVYSNVTANAYQNVAEIRTNLVNQITGRVRWVEQITNMYQSGVDTFIEIGSGKVLNGLIKRIVPDASVYNFSNAAELDQIINLFGKTV